MRRSDTARDARGSDDSPIEATEQPLLINHQQVQSLERRPVVNPADLGEVVGWIGEATEEQIDAAMAAAEAARLRWRAYTPAARGRLLEEAAGRL